MHPITPASRRLVAEAGDDLPIAWLHRSQRYGEKLATPDTSVGDLIGDVDPIRVAQGRTLGDPETIHFGLVPAHQPGHLRRQRAARPGRADPGAACSTCWRSATSRSAATSCGCRWTCCWWPAPTRRTTPTAGRIITPLKDRFGAEIRTHYPLDLELEIDADPAGGGAGRDGARPRARGAGPVRPRRCASRRRSTRARASRPGSRSRPPRRSPRPRCAGPGCSARREPVARDRRHRLGDQHAARQGRVRERRGGPRDRDPRPPAAHGDRRDVPGPAGRAGPVRLHRPGRRGRDHRDRRAGRRPTRCCARSAPVPGLAKVLDRLGLGDAPDPGRGGGRRRVRARGAAPDPAAVQGAPPTRAAPLYGSRE